MKGDFLTSRPPGLNRRPKIERRLAAILAADIKGYSALMDHSEEATHLRVGSEFAWIMKEIERSQGRIFTFAGDGLMAEFPSAVDALRCALRIQGESDKRNARLVPDQWLNYRIGINSGEIMVEGGRTGGTAVNIAARLEQIAEPGSVCLSGAVLDQVKGRVVADYIPIGEHHLKNIRDPVIIYQVTAARYRADAVGPRLPRQFASEGSDTRAEYRPSLAVLPFRTLHKSQADAYFAEGMVDDIIRALGGLKDLVVVSRSSTLGYARAMPDVRRIGRELNVQYVLHGSVRRLDQQIRIAVELDETASQQTLWADRFDGDMTDIFDLQDRIALRTASSIAPYVRERELRRALRKDDRSLTAYDLSLQALDFLYTNDPGALARAEALLKAAIGLDSNYPAALSHLAHLHLVRIVQGWSEDEHADRLAAAEAARRAVDRDRTDALALAIHGHLHGYLLKAHEAALPILDRAIAAGPSCALAWAFSSFACGIMGDTATALARARQARRLSPIGPDATWWHDHALSQAHYLGGQFDEAIAWARMAASHGKLMSNLRCLAASLVAAGQLEQASVVAHQIMQANPRFRLESFRAYTPLRGRIADEFVERLRLAGLPE